MKPLTVYTPDQVTSSMPPDLSSAAWRFLAEGDSWFTLGTLNPAKNSNLLQEMQFGKFACAVNCACPGDTLTRMVDLNRDPSFHQMLAGRRALRWDGILLSCGGNDLIEALAAFGPDVPDDQRLLRRAADWGPVGEGASRYLSEPGWQTFSRYLRANFTHLLALRDSGPSAGCPVFVHAYACPTPRDSGAGLGQGPWLLPSMRGHGVPRDDWSALSALLMKKLAALLADMAGDPVNFPNLHVFDSAAVGLVGATLDAGGVSGDWVNEIHLTRGGYAKVAMPWAQQIEKVMDGG
jgi:hypothetical protein